MNLHETAQLLAVASGFDSRKPDPLQTAAWHEVLRDYDFDECKTAVVEHFRDSATRREYLTIGHVMDRLQPPKTLALPPRRGQCSHREHPHSPGFCLVCGERTSVLA